jgi:hypothetical protein
LLRVYRVSAKKSAKNQQKKLGRGGDDMQTIQLTGNGNWSIESRDTTGNHQTEAVPTRPFNFGKMGDKKGTNAAGKLNTGDKAGIMVARTQLKSRDVSSVPKFTMDIQRILFMELTRAYLNQLRMQLAIEANRETTKFYADCFFIKSKKFLSRVFWCNFYRFSYQIGLIDTIFFQ